MERLETTQLLPQGPSARAALGDRVAAGLPRVASPVDERPRREAGGPAGDALARPARLH